MTDSECESRKINLGSTMGSVNVTSCVLSSLMTEPLSSCSFSFFEVLLSEYVAAATFS
jgi:hypothetical protein